MRFRVLGFMGLGFDVSGLRGLGWVWESKFRVHDGFSGV